MDLKQLEDSMSESEMALFTGIIMAMFSAVEAGADPKALVERLDVHKNNYALRNQKTAELITKGFSAMVQSTVN